MIKIFAKSEESFVSGSRIHPLFKAIGVFLFICLAFLLATREFGIAKDDFNYYNHFSNARYLEIGKIFSYLIEEPLWKLYTWGMTLIFPPMIAFKLTIFLSVMLFLLSSFRVNSKIYLFIILVFIFHQDFATQMYFNQLRQGFALSIFLFITTYKRKPILGGVIATLIHTSFIIPFVLLLLILKVKSIKKIFIYSIVGIAVLFLNISFLKQIDLGRRGDSYLFENKFTINFYLISLIKYVPLLFLIQFYGEKNLSKFWYKLALSSFIVILPFTLFYNAAGRLMYYVNVFFLLMILEHYKSVGGKVALFYFLFFLFFELFFFNFSVFDEWLRIINL
ncbi:MAG: EpsG family protein [Flavobacteriaceae bacterium]|jgi:hypothetical protein|nr:EpsG family protein [Flavobacteriaceae bacterium]